MPNLQKLLPLAEKCVTFFRRGSTGRKQRRLIAWRGIHGVPGTHHLDLLARLHRGIHLDGFAFWDDARDEVAEG